MTEVPSNCFSQVFTCSGQSLVAVQPQQFAVTNEVVENGDISEILSQISSSSTVDTACAMYAAAIPAQIAGNLPEGTVFQIMPEDTAILAVAASSSSPAVPEKPSNCEMIVFQEPSIEGDISSRPGQPPASSGNSTVKVDEENQCIQSTDNMLGADANISDIDLSFLNDPDDPLSNSEADSTQNNVQESLDTNESPKVLGNQETAEALKIDVETGLEGSSRSPSETAPAEVSEPESTIVVDISKPIQLSQNSLIVVDGKKCVLQQDPQTGQVVAYPVKESAKPKKKRGRPRKVHNEESATNDGTNGVTESETAAGQSNQTASDEENPVEKGLLEVVTDDGALVRRSSRKRKKTRILKDYETGNLNQELGSDGEENVLIDKDEEGMVRRRGRHKGPGRPRKYSTQASEILSITKKPRGRPRRYGETNEPTQAFLIQTADGQTLMMQVPLSSIPPGMSLQDVAQDIANKLNSGVSQASAPAKNLETPSLDAGSQSTPLGVEGSKNMTEFLNTKLETISLPAELDSGETDDASKQGDVAEHTEASALSSGVSSNAADAVKDCNLSLVSDESLKSVLPDLRTVSQSFGSHAGLQEPETSLSSHEVSSSGNALGSVIEGINKVSSANKLAELFVNKAVPTIPAPSTEGCLENSDLLQGDLLHADIAETEITTDSREDSRSNEAMDIVLPQPDLSKGPAELPGKMQNTDSYFQDADGNLPLESHNFEFPELNAKEQNSDETLSSVSNSQACSRSLSHSLGNFDHEYETLPPVKNVSSNVLIQDSQADCAASRESGECSVNSAETVEDMSKMDSCTGRESVEPGRNLQSQEGNSQGETFTSVESSQTNLAVQANCAKKRRGRPRKHIVTKQPRMMASLSAIPSLSRVSSVLNPVAVACGSNNSEEGTAQASLTKSSATVIPLPEKVLPLLLPKSTQPDSSVPSASEQKFECQACDFSANFLYEYQQHLSLHPDRTKQCKCCQFLCFTDDKLIQHYTVSHPQCICTKCNYVAEHPYSVKRHMLRHADNGCTCEICGKTYKDHYILKMHVKMVHMPAEVLYKCHLCQKQFNRKAHLKRHLRTHDPEKPYKCPRCEYRGSEKSDLTKHMLIHEEPKHICEICGKAFRHIKNKELHLKRHKNQRDYRCGVCNFLGYTFTDIRKHILRRHMDSATPLCSACGQAFKSQDQIKEHQLSGQCESFLLAQKFETLEGTLLQVPSVTESTGLTDGETVLVNSTESGQLVSMVPSFAVSSGIVNNQIVLRNVDSLLNLGDGEVVIGELKNSELSLPVGAVISSDQEAAKGSSVKLANGLVEQLSSPSLVSSASLAAINMSAESSQQPTTTSDGKNFLDTSTNVQVNMLFQVGTVLAPSVKCSISS